MMAERESDGEIESGPNSTHQREDFLAASLDGHRESVQTLLDKIGPSVLVTGEYARSQRAAIRRGNYDMVQMLLEKAAE